MTAPPAHRRRPRAAARRLGRALVKRRWQMASAESCTGGLVGHVITQVSRRRATTTSAASISYSNAVKDELLGVARRPDRPRRCGLGRGRRGHGERSPGCASRSRSWASSVTGIAGPGRRHARTSRSASPTWPPRAATGRRSSSDTVAPRSRRQQARIGARGDRARGAHDRGGVVDHGRGRRADPRHRHRRLRRRRAPPCSSSAPAPCRRLRRRRTVAVHAAARRGRDRARITGHDPATWTGIDAGRHLPRAARRSRPPGARGGPASAASRSSPGRRCSAS